MNIRATSVDTVRKCAACGERFVPEYRGGGCLSSLVRIVAGGIAGIVIIVVAISFSISWLSNRARKSTAPPPPAPAARSATPQPPPPAGSRATPAPQAALLRAATPATVPTRLSSATAPSTQAAVIQAQARVTASAAEFNSARAAALQRLAATPAYAKLKAEADQLEAAAKKMREAGERGQVLASTSAKWIEAKGRLKKLQEQVNADAGVAAAAAKLAAANAGLAAAQREVR